MLHIWDYFIAKAIAKKMLAAIVEYKIIKNVDEYAMLASSK
jgi:hypothetical protein